MKPSINPTRHTRVVLFMTRYRPADVPSLGNPLACLLPLGSAMFAEKVMESCALAGLRHVDVVASDYPEVVRAALGDGSAWGLKISWHLVKNPAAPYKVLGCLNFMDDDLVVIGHGDQWVSERVINSLQQRPGAAMHVGQAVCWTGWFSDKAKHLRSLDYHGKFSAMADAVISRRLGVVLAQDLEYSGADSAAGLLQAQQIALESPLQSAPASWRRMPWGAMSPDASVGTGAAIVGPVLIGPGCVVDGYAQIGPSVVLTRDVFISGGAEVRNTVVLPNTYVDGRVTLDHVVVQGNVVQSLKRNVRTVLAKEDAMLTPLFDTWLVRTPLGSRLLGVLLAAALLPAFMLFVFFQLARRKPLFWLEAMVVKSRDVQTGELNMTTVRVPHSGGWLQTSVGLYGAVVDVIQGRRRWFGLRPRTASAWYTLSRDWQNLFSHSMIGVFHAPSWSEYKCFQDGDSLAVADAFMAAQSSLRCRLGLIAKWVLGFTLKVFGRAA